MLCCIVNYHHHHNVPHFRYLSLTPFPQTQNVAEEYFQCKVRSDTNKDKQSKAREGPPKVQCCPKLVPLSSTEEPLPLEVDTILRPHTCHRHLTVGMKKINYHQRCTPLHCRKTPSCQTYIEPLEKQWSLDVMMIIGGAEKAIYGI